MHASGERAGPLAQQAVTATPRVHPTSPALAMLEQVLQKRLALSQLLHASTHNHKNYYGCNYKRRTDSDLGAPSETSEDRSTSVGAYDWSEEKRGTTVHGNNANTTFQRLF